MAPSHVSIRREVLIQKWEDLEASGCISPVTHKIHHDGEHALQLNARSLHAAIGIVREASGESTARLGVGEYGVAFCAQGKSKKFGAWRYTLVLITSDPDY